jgi:hypothetical protein
MEEDKKFTEEHDEWAKQTATEEPYMIDYETVWEIRKQNTEETVKHQLTLKSSVYNAFLDFLQTHSGTQPRRGKGISSAIIEMFIRLGMAFIAGFNVQECAEDMRNLFDSEYSRDRIKENIQEFVRML